MRCEGGAAEEDAADGVGEAAGSKRKTRTPHSDVGNNEEWKEEDKVKKSSGHVTRPKAFLRDINLPPLPRQIGSSSAAFRAFGRGICEKEKWRRY